MSVSYTPPSAAKGTILAFHGGCFTGGSPSWDLEQSTAIASRGYNVIQVAFPKTASKFRDWTATFDFSTIEPPIFCLGRSSGGYLAKEFYEFHQDTIDKAVYICPVFSPITRCALKPKFEEKTMRFFGVCEPRSTFGMDRGRELVMLAARDDNVPRECFSVPQLKEAVYLGPTTHTGMLTCCSKKFLYVLDTFLCASIP